MVKTMELQVIPRDEALRLVASVPVGRVVFTLRALPAVLPVNFVLDGDAIVFRTAPGSKLTAAVRNAVVAFQVDQIDPQTQTGWSVLVTGRAGEIHDPAEIARLRARLKPWAPGEREHLSGSRPSWSVAGGLSCSPGHEPATENGSHQQPIALLATPSLPRGFAARTFPAFRSGEIPTFHR